MSNEAAERLLTKWVASGDLPRPPKGGWTVPRLIAYLEADIRATERKATVERIRAALGPVEYPMCERDRDFILRLLDAEAAR